MVAWYFLIVAYVVGVATLPVAIQLVIWYVNAHAYDVDTVRMAVASNSDKLKWSVVGFVSALITVAAAFACRIISEFAAFFIYG
ncbi:MAG: hypothetical protein HZB51_34100 [Chloroflexi bacterium]|nr:hypothetical protein [Chloroflexota bacterium]